jgi:protein-tyrosine-phosphatase
MRALALTHGSAGEGPSTSTIAAASELGIALPEGFAASKFDDEEHIVQYDVLLVMDKYTAADVLREVRSRSGGGGGGPGMELRRSCRC